VFDDDNFAGRSAQLAPGRYDLEQLESLGSENDTITSICVAPGCSVTLYEDFRFQGRSIVVTADARALPEFSRTASSLMIACSP
jgi:hypothetical protein